MKSERKEIPSRTGKVTRVEVPSREGKRVIYVKRRFFRFRAREDAEPAAQFFRFLRNKGVYPPGSKFFVHEEKEKPGGFGILFSIPEVKKISDEHWGDVVKLREKIQDILFDEFAPPAVKRAAWRSGDYADGDVTNPKLYSTNYGVGEDGKIYYVDPHVFLSSAASYEGFTSHPFLRDWWERKKGEREMQSRAKKQPTPPKKRSIFRFFRKRK